MKIYAGGPRRKRDGGDVRKDRNEDIGWRLENKKR